MGKFIDEVLSVPPGAYIQSADPAIANPSWLQPKILWLDTSSSPYVLKKRNADNDGWDTLGKLRTDAEFNTDVDGRITAANLATDAELAAAVATLDAADASLDTRVDALETSGAPPLAHKTAHENGGGDEISVAGLSGVLADPQVPITENVQDIAGAMATDSSTIGFTYDDGAGTLTAIVKDASIDAAKLAPASVNAQTGTTYTLQASDNNKVITFSNAGAIAVTVPSGLGAGFSCLCVQLGAGQVTFSPSSTTVNNRQSHTKIAGQYGVVSLVAYVANTFVLGGDTAA